MKMINISQTNRKLITASILGIVIFCVFFMPIIAKGASLGTSQYSSLFKDYSGTHNNEIEEMIRAHEESKSNIQKKYNLQQRQLLQNSTVTTTPDTVEIWTAEDLYNVRNNLFGNYIQRADIDLSGYSNWTPIGEGDMPFFGIYDGDGFSITGLNINSPDSDQQGLFNLVYQGTLKNITVYGNLNAYSGGLLVGHMIEGLVENSHAIGTAKGNSQVGLLMGSFEGNVSDCSTNGLVEASQSGGLLAGFSSNGNVDNCHVNGTLTGDWGLGGLIGLFDGTVYRCSSQGEVISTDCCVGGLIGDIYGSRDTLISESFSNSEVIAGYTVGGFIGEIYVNYNTSVTIKNCYATGSVLSTVDFPGPIGGFAGTTSGNNINIINCYSCGNVNRPNQIRYPDMPPEVEQEYLAYSKGGFLGSLSSGSPRIVDCYYDSQTSGQTDTGKGRPQSTSDMHSWGTYRNWDFSSIWTINLNENDGYPYLKDPEMDDSIPIWTAQDLDNVRYGLNKNYIQMADIDLSGYNNWIPIGTGSYPFTGKYDGNGFKISNLKIYRSDIQAGLFGVLETPGELNNIKLVGINILADWVVGGLVGDSSGKVSNSYVTGQITASGTDENGTITTYTLIGGLVGVNMGTVTKSWAAVDVVLILNGNPLSYYRYAGGLIGANGSRGLVSNSYATGSVTSNQQKTIGLTGGLIGRNSGILYYSYSIGKVIGQSVYTGGLVGWNDDYAILSSYYDYNTSGQSTSGEYAKSTEEMHNQATYDGWNFVSIWAMDPNKNNGYPYLRDVGIPEALSGKGATEYCLHYDPQTRQSSWVLEPIDAATGAQMIEKQLLQLNGVISIDFNVRYNSLMLAPGPLGKGWNHNFETCIIPQTDGSIMLAWSANQNNIFRLSGDSTYISSDQACRLDILVKNTDGSYVLTRRDQSEYRFDSSGKLIQLANAHGQVINFSYDTANRLQTIIEPVSQISLTLNYNADNLITNTTDGLNRQITFTYDTNQNLTQISYPDNKSIIFTYDEGGQIQSETDGENKLVFFNIYDNQGRIVSQKDGLNQISTLSYNENKQLGKIITTITDRTGKTQIYIHNDQYELEQLTDELGNSIAYTYDDNGNRTSVTDPAGHVTTMNYDSRNNLLSIKDPANHTSIMTYDEKNNLLTTTNATAKVTIYTYDEYNNLLSVTNPLNQSTSYTYNEQGLVVAKTSPSGGVTSYTYENGRLKTATDPSGSITTYGYDQVGRLINITNPAGKITSLVYDARDNLLSTTDPLGHTTLYTYDSNGNRLSETDPQGNTTIFIYDANCNLVQQTDALGNHTYYEYDGEDRLIKITDAKGNSTTITYDAKGRKIAATDALGNTVSLQYDNVDNNTGIIDPLGNQQVNITYDALRNPLTITDALGNRIINQYDSLNRLTHVTDPLNQVTSYNYDDLNRLVSVIDAANGISTQAFDGDGNQINIVDPNQNQTGFIYDQAGKLTETKTQANVITSYQYNPNGLISETTNGRGQITAYAYDDADRLITKTDDTGSTNYTYDANGNLLTVTDVTGTISRTYDELNRITSYTDARGNSIQYQYDQIGNLICLTYPGGKQVNYTYDAANRLTQVTDWAGRTTSYGYDANSRVVNTNRPNGSIETRSYDAAGHLTQQKDVDQDGNVICQYDFIYDAAGNIIEEISSVPNSDYTIQAKTMTYRGDNRLLTYNGQAVQYDADGNMANGPVNGGPLAMNYDCRNRLVNAGDTGYTYDAENNRIAVTKDDAATSYVVNPTAALSQVLMRTDASGIMTYYVYGLGLMGEETAADYRVYHYDYRGSTAAITDSTGAITDQYQYGPYGELTNHIGTGDTLFLYNGRDGVMTDHNGLYYMRARYYNPEINRFVNMDVLLGDINEGQSLNRFIYVNGNPISGVDPLGLKRDCGISTTFSDPMPFTKLFQAMGEVDWDAFFVALSQSGYPPGMELGQGGLLITRLGGKTAPALKALTATSKGAGKVHAPQKVIGHFPEYVEMSSKLGTKPFSIPENIWSKMTPSEQWAANQKFLDRAIAKGSEFNLATPIDKVRPGSFLQKEIEYLTSQGYKLSNDGTKLVK